MSYSWKHLRVDQPYLVLRLLIYLISYSLVNIYNIIDRNPSPNDINLKLLVQINENRKQLREDEVLRARYVVVLQLIASTLGLFK